MVQLTINSIPVDFPYDPYPAQIRYMSHVIDALRSGNNALLESPTGTGKTLCLLCATLAWRTTYVAALQAQAHATPDTKSNNHQLSAVAGLNINTTSNPNSDETTATALLSALAPEGTKSNANASNNNVKQFARPRIVYASRTHSQLSQAVSELKKTIYRPSMSFVASRDQLCIHEISTTLSGTRLNAMCRRITNPSKRKCRYHLPVMSPRSYENRSIELVSKVQNEPPMDIEDLKSFGHKESACPFFLSRLSARSDDCDILFLPYNYIIDNTSRSSLDIDWSNDVIIIDEAHNLEAICSDAVSFDLSSQIRVACDTQLAKLVETGLRPAGISIPALEQLANKGGERGIDHVLGSENRDLLEIRLMRSIMSTVENFINNADLDRGKDTDVLYAVFPAQRLRAVMQEAGGPTLETYDLYMQMLDRVLDKQAESIKLNEDGTTDTSSTSEQHQQQQTNNNSNNNAIRILQTAIRVLFETQATGNENCFRTVIQQSVSRPNLGRTLSHWCFKPSVAMQSIDKLNTRCMLLTSGTLSPLDSFASELGLEFPVRLENPHVITKPQVWAGVVKSGPDLLNGLKGGRLTSAYFARGDDSSVELGRCILRFAAVIPDGMLVFYPSYASLFSCVDAWKRLGPGPDRSKPSIWEHLHRLKRVVTEERDSSKVSAAVLAHRANIDGRHGSILLAVCRGKVSEGIDFSDEYGRAVIITGLPYPSALDPKVVLKREYADEESRRYRTAPASSLSSNRRGKERDDKNVMSGAQWYTVQALRAVNQAVGRAIRHRFDYGAILLCDERFQSIPLQGQISKWIRPNIIVHADFQKAHTSLDQFFTRASESEFAKEGDKRRVAAQKRLRELADRRRVSQQQQNEDTNAVLLAQGAINQFLPPPKTEAQFVDQMVSISDEIKADHFVMPSSTRKKTSMTTLNAMTPSSSTSAAAATEKIQPRSTLAVMQLSSQNAKAGSHDSGSSVERSVYLNSQSYNNNNQNNPTLKRSALFLASRSQKQQHAVDTERGKDHHSHHHQTTNGSAMKKARRTVEKSHDRTRRSGGGSEKLSEKIKKMFDKEDVRPFLNLFRQLLAINSKLVDGIGPLQSETELHDNRQSAREKITQIVDFIRQKARYGYENGVGNSYFPDTFLQELKAKIPAQFQQWYEEEVNK